LIIAIAFGNYYRKLAPMAGLIAAVPADRVKSMREICKQIRKKRLKDEPGIVQTNDGKCRAQLLQGRAFFVQKDLQKAFFVTQEQLAETIDKPDAKRLKIIIRHPIEKTVYAFDARNSERLNAWLAAESLPAAAGGAPPPLPV
jgi:hypothetical protein